MFADAGPIHEKGMNACMPPRPVTLACRMHACVRSPRVRVQVKAAMKKLDKREREASEADAEKRKFNSLEGGEHVTPEEMEAYRIKKSRGEDPLLAAKAGTVGADGYEIL